jgi:hypothetical protein
MTDRVVKQRTALLKTAAQARRAGRGSVADLRTLDVWDAIWPVSGRNTDGKARACQSIGPLVDKAYESLAGETSAGPVVMEYRSSLALTCRLGPAARWSRLRYSPELRLHELMNWTVVPRWTAPRRPPSTPGTTAGARLRQPW